MAYELTLGFGSVSLVTEHETLDDMMDHAAKQDISCIEEIEVSTDDAFTREQENDFFKSLRF